MTYRTLVVLLLSTGPGLAQAEPAIPTEATPEATELTKLETARAAAMAEGKAHAAEVARISALLDAASTMLDRAAPDDSRVSAVHALVNGRDVRVLRLAHVGSQTGSASVRLAVIKEVRDWDHPSVRRLLEARAQAVMETMNVREAAILGIRDRGDTEAATFLYALATDRKLSPEARALALAALDSHFSTFIADKDRPSMGGTFVGLSSAIVGNALAGGVLLNSVGTWGKSEAAPGIGALSGTIIGASTAALYGKIKPISTGQGLGYASNVTWGLVGGVMASDAIYGDPEDESSENMAALFRTLGVGVGAYTGYRRMGRNPSPGGVWRVNGAGFLGAQLGRSMTGVGQAFGGDESFQCDDRTEAEREACYTRENIQDRKLSRGRSAGMLAGSALGLAAGTLVQDTWAPDFSHAALAGVVGIETMTAMGLVPVIMGRSDLTGPAMDVGFFAGVTGGLVASQLHPVSLEQTTMIGYGALFGNVLAASASMLPTQDVSERTQASIVLPSGIAGAALGGYLYPHIRPGLGDWSMIGVGTGLSALHLASATFIIGEQGVFNNDRQAMGVIATGTTLASAGFMAAAARYDPDPIDSLFMGTAAVWGGFYGSVGQVAADSNLSPVGAVLVGTLAVDLGLGAGALILSDATPFGPRDTLVPQLFGVAGATVGSLSVMLGTDGAQPVSIAAITGATLGLGIGAVVAPSLDLNGSESVFDLIPGPKLRLPGHWNFLALPAVQQDGTLGTAMVLEARGL
jgi:hypothetical protein